jgi:hypothetical protein
MKFCAAWYQRGDPLYSDGSARRDLIIKYTSDIITGKFSTGIYFSACIWQENSI